MSGPRGGTGSDSPREPNGVAFLPDGKTIVAAFRGGVQVWRAPTLGEIAAKEKMEARK
jgi:hypothetical protein